MVPFVSEELRRWRRANLCAKHDSLFREWREAARMYATTLAELLGRVGQVIAPQLFERAMIVEILRRLTADVRAELDEHIAEHHC